MLIMSRKIPACLRHVFERNRIANISERADQKRSTQVQAIGRPLARIPFVKKTMGLLGCHFQSFAFSACLIHAHAHDIGAGAT